MKSLLIRSPLCIAVLLGAALTQAPGWVLAQSQTATAAAANSSAPSKTATRATAKKTAVPPAQSLDLKAPPLSHIYPREQLQYILAIDNADVEGAQEVSVKGEKYLMPVPNSQLQAIPWALMHPADAWRIFTPIESP